MIERPYWQRVLYSIWPKIHRMITGVVFWIFMILRSAVKIAMEQIKQI